VLSPSRCSINLVHLNRANYFYSWYCPVNFPFLSLPISLILVIKLTQSQERKVKKYLYNPNITQITIFPWMHILYFLWKIISHCLYSLRTAFFHLVIFVNTFPSEWIFFYPVICNDCMLCVFKIIYLMKY
jgi:hypothetical protein